MERESLAGVSHEDAPSNAPEKETAENPTRYTLKPLSQPFKYRATLFSALTVTHAQSLMDREQNRSNKTSPLVIYSNKQTSLSSSCPITQIRCSEKIMLLFLQSAEWVRDELASQSQSVLEHSLQFCCFTHLYNLYLGYITMWGVHDGNSMKHNHEVISIF